MKRLTQQELESYLWGAAVLLRGLIDAGDYKQYIFPLLFFKRISDVWNEEYQAALADSGGDLSYAEFAENHRFQIPEGAHWDTVRQTPKNVGMPIQTALRQLEPVDPAVCEARNRDDQPPRCRGTAGATCRVGAMAKRWPGLLATDGCLGGNPR